MLKNVKMLFLMKTWFGITILVLLAIDVVMPAFAKMDKKAQIAEARHAVESFCIAEFQGDEFNQRVKLIKFSPARQKKENKRTGPASPWVVFWDWDPFYIVSSYKILSVELKDDRGVATVEYRRMAKSKGEGQIIPSEKARDIAKLDLIYDGRQWWIFDPPLPRISIKVLIEIYEQDLRTYDERWFKSASTEQRKTYAQKQEALKVLMSLSK